MDIIMTEADKMLEMIRAKRREAAANNHFCGEIILDKAHQCSIEPPEDEETPEQAFDRAMRGI